MSPSAFGADDQRDVAPAVFEPEHFHEPVEAEQPDERASDQPDSVLIPTSEVHTAGDQVQVELRHTETGDLALPIYTSVNSLVACCGEQQPWLAVTLDALPKYVTSAGAAGVVQDVELPHEGGEDRGGI